MKRILLIVFLPIFGHLAIARNSIPDTLSLASRRAINDTNLVDILLNKSAYYRGINPDSGLIYLKRALALSRRINYKFGETNAIGLLGLYDFDRGNLAGSMKIAFESLPKAQAINDYKSIWGGYTLLSLDYFTLQDYKQAFKNLFLALHVSEKHHLRQLSGICYDNLVYFYIKLNRADSAEHYNRIVTQFKPYVTEADIFSNTAAIQLLKGNYDTAISDAHKGLNAESGENDHTLSAGNFLIIAKAYQKLSRPDSALFFGKKALDDAKKAKRPDELTETANFVSALYKARNDYKNAYDYEQVMLAARDSLYNQRKDLQVQSVTEEEVQRKNKAEAAKEAYQKNAELFWLLGLAGVFIIIAFILLYHNRQRKKANLLLIEQKQEVQNTLTQLKAAQTQLIQSEKMASLGELTAGIAHEIQNPLNFVNNFSEVSAEMIDELDEELNKGDLTEAKAIVSDVKQNLGKINHHGKRADAIVKSMLEHSKATSGEKEPTNLNMLVEEYLRMAYHGLRAKDKSFNAEMLTHFDKNLPKANIVAQDIGRVMLNLFNNAFYAVHQKAKTAGAGYKPTVEVSTSQADGQVIISVKDNGPGIPDAIKDKIMQPFFTTKPTGEGTGLGLSLSYDIVVKGHEGTINVDTKENEFTEFTVTMPIN